VKAFRGLAGQLREFIRRPTRTRQREAPATPPARGTAEGFIARGGHVQLYRDISRKNPFHRVQGKRGYTEEGVASPSWPGICPEQGDLRSRREIGFQEYITRVSRGRS
jgi:hypothetical protein